MNPRLIAYASPFFSMHSVVAWLIENKGWARPLGALRLAALPVVLWTAAPAGQATRVAIAGVARVVVQGLVRVGGLGKSA